MGFSRNDWLEHGLRILTAHGPEELKIDRLCDRLGVTKGSFYHHFGNRRFFIEALLGFWEEQNTTRLIQAAETVADARERGRLLSDLVRGAEQAPEVALRAWARQDPAVATFVRRVDTRRVDYLIKLIKATYGDAPHTKVVAKLLYANLVGIQQLRGVISAREWRQMDELMHQWLEAAQGPGR